MYPREYFDTYWRPELRDEVFVAMSFAPSFDPTWRNIITPAIEEVGLKPHRVDTTRISGSILTEIMEGIAHARVVLADISTEITADLDGRDKAFRNANVHYELGLAHALRQKEETLVIRQDSDPISFDVSGIRIHKYDPSDPDGAKTQIADLLKACLEETDLVKGLKVEQAHASLDYWCLELMGTHSSQPFFPEPSVHPIAVAAVRLALFKMLELGILRFETGEGGGKYAYHWTEFGKAVLARIGFRAGKPSATV